jgi:hypothetical protein
MRILKNKDGSAISRREWRKIIYQKWIVKNVPFFLFLSVLTIIYIANGHYADKARRKINTTAKRLKELEYEYKTIKREVIFRSKESELVKAVEPLGLKELLIPPMIIADSTE